MVQRSVVNVGDVRYFKTKTVISLAYFFSRSFFVLPHCLKVTFLRPVFEDYMLIRTKF